MMPTTHPCELCGRAPALALTSPCVAGFSTPVVCQACLAAHPKRKALDAAVGQARADRADQERARIAAQAVAGSPRPQAGG